MKKLSFVMSFLAATLMVLSGAQISLAGDLKVSGFADIILTLMDEGSDDEGSDSDGKVANSAETKTGISAEVDFEYTEGPVTFRLDLDVPSLGNEAAGVLPGNVDADGEPLSGYIGVEQAKFVWMIPGGDPVALSLTGGAFNAPIGFESQDAPDLYQTSNGQLFGLVPSNLAGFMVSGGAGPVTADVYFANEWRANDAEENSIGGLITITSIEMASLAVGYITSPDSAGVTPPADGDGSVLDVVASLNAEVMPLVQGLLVAEFLTDENNTAFAIVANVMHETASYPHGLTVRFDSVDCDTGSTYCGGKATPTSLTVAASVGLAENLGALIEWKMMDPDVSDDPSTPGIDESDSINMLTLEFVATFN